MHKKDSTLNEMYDLIKLYYCSSSNQLLKFGHNYNKQREVICTYYAGNVDKIRSSHMRKSDARHK